MTGCRRPTDEGSTVEAGTDTGRSKISIAGLNCNGNPLHPNTAIGDTHAEDIRRSIRLASRLGQHRVVTMSGLSGGEPGATRTNWIVNAWNSAALDVLDYQWQLAVPFWHEIDALAGEHDVKVALELHPQNLVVNTADVHKLIELTGATNVGVELDASHLFWQQMDPIAVVRKLGRLVYHVGTRLHRRPSGRCEGGPGRRRRTHRIAGQRVTVSVSARPPTRQS